MAHTAKVILKCDIEYKNKIVFENKQVYFYADVELSKCRCWDEYTVEDWNTDDETYRANRYGYLYSTILKEWCSDKDVEEFDAYADYTDFTLLVKEEDYDDLEIDYEMFEPDWDLINKERY